jgi:hypothetical protein
MISLWADYQTVAKDSFSVGLDSQSGIKVYLASRLEVRGCVYVMIALWLTYGKGTSFSFIVGSQNDQDILDRDDQG